MTGVKNTYAEDDMETSQQIDGNDTTADDRFVPETDQEAFDSSGAAEVSDSNVRHSHICHAYHCLNNIVRMPTSREHRLPLKNVWICPFDPDHFVTKRTCFSAVPKHQGISNGLSTGCSTKEIAWRTYM
jgi:hypothetical protein